MAKVSLLFKYADKSISKKEWNTPKKNIENTANEIDVMAMYDTFVEMNKWLKKFQVSFF